MTNISPDGDTQASHATPTTRDILKGCTAVHDDIILSNSSKKTALNDITSGIEPVYVFENVHAPPPLPTADVQPISPVREVFIFISFLRFKI